MDEKLGSGSSIPGGSYRGFMHVHDDDDHHHQNSYFRQLPRQSVHCQHQRSMMQPPMLDNFHPQMNRMKDGDQQVALPVMDYDRQGERCKNSASDDDEPSLNTDGVICPNEAEKEKGSPWQRMKWSNLMVRLLITAVSYLGDDALSGGSSSARRKASIVQKKGKWKLISKVLAERSFYVSPQQCEDKFNDLNKRYKRLTDILGRGTSCKVVENPALLDLMSHVSDKAKDDARKILNSKNLFYEEMCSFHNGNRLNLPADPGLLCSLQSAILSNDDHDAKRKVREDLEEDAQGDLEDGEEDNEESCFHKRMKHRMDHEEISFSDALGSQDFNSPDALLAPMETGHILTEGTQAAWVHLEMMRSRSCQLEGQCLLIQSQMLDLEQQRIKWKRFNKKKDKEVDKLRMENERTKLENGKLALDLKQKQLELGIN